MQSSSVGNTHTYALPQSVIPQTLLQQVIASETPDNKKTLERLLENKAITPSELCSLLEHSYEPLINAEWSRPFITRALFALHTSNNDLHRAFEVAIRHQDAKHILEMLQQGYEPEPHHLRMADTKVKDLLTAAWRKARLYSKDDHNDDTDLDKALRNSDFKQAGTLLKSQMSQISQISGKKFDEIWAYAIEHKKTDVLRGMLIFGTLDKSRNFRLKEKPEHKIEDTRILALLKEIPQYSPKRGSPLNLNYKAPGIVCRHLAFHRQQVQAGNEAMKSRYISIEHADQNALSSDPGIVETVNDVQKNVHVTDIEIANLERLATEVHLVDNSEFGTFIAGQFEEMTTNAQNSKQIYVESTIHAMSLGLRIKEKDGKKIYVAKFYDPNMTTSHVRSASENLTSFEIKKQSMSAYLQNETILDHYFPEKKGVSMMFVRPPETTLAENKNTLVSLRHNRELKLHIAESKVDSTVMWHLFRGGFAKQLRHLKGAIAIRPETERSTLLAAKVSRTNHERTEVTPGLYLAFQHGYSDTIKAFGELLELVPEDKRAELVAAKNSLGIHGLYVALYKDHTDVIKAFGELLTLVPEGERAGLLAAKNIEGTPGLLIALKAGNTDAIEAFGPLLKSMPTIERTELLAEVAAGLGNAMKGGLTQTLDAYTTICMEALPDLDAKQRTVLLNSIIKTCYRGVSGHWQAEWFFSQWATANPESHQCLIELQQQLRR